MVHIGQQACACCVPDACSVLPLCCQSVQALTEVSQSCSTELSTGKLVKHGEPIQYTLGEAWNAATASTIRESFFRGEGERGTVCNITCTN